MRRVVFQWDVDCQRDDVQGWFVRVFVSRNMGGFFLLEFIGRLLFACSDFVLCASFSNEDQVVKLESQCRQKSD